MENNSASTATATTTTAAAAAATANANASTTPAVNRQNHSTNNSFSPSHLAARFRNLVSTQAPMFGHRHGKHLVKTSSTNTSAASAAADNHREQLQKRDDLIAQLRKQVAFKDEQIAYLASELDKYQSVFNQKPSALGLSRGCWHKLDVGAESDGGPRKRGIGISAEPQALRMDEKEHPRHYPKTAK